MNQILWGLVEGHKKNRIVAFGKISLLFWKQVIFCFCNVWVIAYKRSTLGGWVKTGIKHRLRHISEDSRFHWEKISRYSGLVAIVCLKKKTLTLHCTTSRVKLVMAHIPVIQNTGLMLMPFILSLSVLLQHQNKEGKKSRRQQDALQVFFCLVFLFLKASLGWCLETKKAVH